MNSNVARIESLIARANAELARLEELASAAAREGRLFAARSLEEERSHVRRQRELLKIRREFCR